MSCRNLNAGILTARKRVKIQTRRKTYAKPLIILALLSFSFATGWQTHKPAPLIVTKIESHSYKVPIFLPVPTNHTRKFVTKQLDMIAAAIPAKALQPMKGR